MPALLMPAARSRWPRKNGAALSRPISTRCSFGRRKRRAACWRQTPAAASSTSPRCSASASIGVIAYATAKAGVIQLTKALALELAFKGIRVNAIAPGWIVTELNRDYLQTERGAAIKREIPIGRFGEECDLDGPLLLLASDAGRFVTGATIVADGGQMVALRG